MGIGTGFLQTQVIFFFNKLLILYIFRTTLAEVFIYLFYLLNFLNLSGTFNMYCRFYYLQLLI